MEDNIENIEIIVKHWSNSSDNDYNTMQNLIKSGDFNWALFLGHLVIEKLLKAHFAKNNHKHPIFTHDLLRLASKAGLNISKEYEEWLDDITTFNINTRYDNYKQNFYNLCTKEFAEIWILRIVELRQWLIKTL